MCKITVSTTAINCCYDKNKNIQKCIEYVKKASEKNSRLIVFPEMVIQGYLYSLTGPATAEEIIYQQKNAEYVPEGDSVQRMIKAAKDYNTYIVFGICERDKNVFDILYNTAVLVGPEGFVGSYRKVHFSMDERHVFTSGTEFPVYDTDIGRIGMQICCDKALPGSTWELMLGAADIIVNLACWTDYIGDAPDSIQGKIASRYDIWDVCRAMEGQTFFISSNQFGQCGKGNYCGKSNIVNPEGFILESVGAKEGFVSVETDIREEIMRTRAAYFENLTYYQNFNAYRRIMNGKGILQSCAAMEKNEATGCCDDC